MKASRLLPLAALCLVLLLSTTAFIISTRDVRVSGVVSDAATQAPLADVDVTFAGQSVRTDAQGHFAFAPAERHGVLTATAAGYQPAESTLSVDSWLVGDERRDLSLEPTVLSGVVSDSASGAPLGGVAISIGVQAQTTAGDGAYRFLRVQAGQPIAISADGYDDGALTYNGEDTLSLALTPNTVVVAVVDAESGAAIASAAVTTSTKPVTLPLRGIKLQTPIAATADGYLPGSTVYDGGPGVTVALTPNTVGGALRDQYSGQPLAGVTMTLAQAGQTLETTTDQSGRFAFRRVRSGAAVSARAEGHTTASMTYTGQSALDLTLRPNVLQGAVLDKQTGKPIAGATLSLGSLSAKSGQTGAYRLQDVPEGGTLVISAPGYDRATLPVSRTTLLDARLQPFTARGIYIPFYLLTMPDRVRALIDFADRHGMNTIVVDIKGDDGRLAYQSSLPLAKDLHAAYTGSMIGLDEVLALAKKRGMYTIARITVFKDPVLALGRPDLAITDSRTGRVWDDCGNGSTYWADPFRKEVVDYNVGIAEEGARLGFDEIQYDYIRFPPACTSGAPMAKAVFAAENTEANRVQAISTFLAATQQRLKPLGTAIAVDTFGWTLMRKDDLGIGQHIETLAKYVDYINPMLYPSTWQNGSAGLDYVPAHPYEIVYASIKQALARLKDTPHVKLRPWLQDFDDYLERGLPYGVQELNAQRKGSDDGGGEGWLLWNAGGVYTEEGLPPATTP